MPQFSAGHARVNGVNKYIRTVILVIVIHVCISLIDYYTTSQTKVIVLYFFPIYIATYYLSTLWGIVFALGSILSNILIIFFEDTPITSLIVFNNVMQLSAYLVVVYLIFQIRKKQDIIHQNLIQKEIIIKDIHHRMKNQMSSLLSLISLSNINRNEHIQSVYNRISSYHLLYDSLCYHSNDQDKIYVKTYIESLVNNIRMSMMPADNNIDFVINDCDIMLDNKLLINFGLIINEMITNSIKHAYKEKKDGKIIISMSAKEHTIITLHYQDDGSGFEMTEEAVNTSLGLLIINSLVKQMRGTLNFSNRNGTEYSITIKI